MRQINTKKRILNFGPKKSAYLVLGIFILVIVNFNVQAQLYVAGEMDLNQKTVDQDQNPGSADWFTDADFKLYPNPANNMVWIQSKANFKDGVIITLFDIRGTLLEKRVLKSEKSRKDYSINLSRYSGGQYIIGIRSIDGSYVAKKLIKRS